MGRFSRAELETAVHHYEGVVQTCSDTGEWSAFADLFTEDVHYTEHVYGEFHGREQVRQWIVDVMAPLPHMRFPARWRAFDEENDAVVIGVRNVLEHPTEPGVLFEFPNVTRLVYAGNGLFSSEEDVYNPARDVAKVVTSWLQAGGELACAPKVDMKHTS